MAAFVTTLLGVFGCQDALDPVDQQPPKTDSPPFAVGAPQLELTNHPHGWQKLDCTTCHTTRLVAGHGGLGGDQCVSCHGFNGTQAAQCNSCHGRQSSTGDPDSGLHAFHVGTSSFGCDTCHAKNIHRNGGLELQIAQGARFVKAASELNSSDAVPEVFATPGCTDGGCHEARAWKVDACTSCHATPPDSPMHAKHLARGALTKGGPLSCRDCHAGNQHDADKRAGIIEVGGGAKWKSWDGFTGACETACHAKLEQWDCQSCHGYPPSTGKHTTHAEDYRVECVVCHEGHTHSYQAAVAPKDARATVEVKFLFQRGTWDSAAGTCANTGCHPTRSWRN
ncbi:hypothetical protein FJZ36_07435 [Candidatus Poribacteria bacterium]|nr:hypothetical protein [Candidatus Poribacteria bacterium]